MSKLIERFGAVVTTEELVRHGWTGKPPSTTALRVHITRIRKRIEPLGLDIRGVRPFGYVLEEAPDRQHEQHQP
jgi:two-component system OmpR family response regulator